MNDKPKLDVFDGVHSTVNGVTFHTHLLKMFKEFNIYEENKGVCYGYSATGLNAFVNGKLDVFAQSLVTLSGYSADSNDIEMQREELIRKMKNKLPLYQQDYEYLEVRGLIENIAINQSATQFPQLFDHELEASLQPQHHQRAANFTPAGDESTHAGQIQEVSNHVSVYSVDELGQSLQSLIDGLPKESGPLGFMIVASRHALGVGYEPATGCWLLLDANSKPEFKVATTQEVSDYIFSAFQRIDEQGREVINPTVSAVNPKPIAFVIKTIVARDSYRNQEATTIQNWANSQQSRQIDLVNNKMEYLFMLIKGNEMAQLESLLSDQSVLAMLDENEKKLLVDVSIACGQVQIFNLFHVKGWYHPELVEHYLAEAINFGKPALLNRILELAGENYKLDLQKVHQLELKPIIIPALLKHIPEDERQSFLNQALFNALFKNDFFLFRHLLEAGADPNCQNDLGVSIFKSVIEYALMTKNVDERFLFCLYEFGAQVDEDDTCFVSIPRGFEVDINLRNRLYNFVGVLQENHEVRTALHSVLKDYNPISDAQGSQVKAQAYAQVLHEIHDLSKYAKTQHEFVALVSDLCKDLDKKYPGSDLSGRVLKLLDNISELDAHHQGPSE